jgi:glycosyltransferase involved in cell wall biosynthesis
MDSNTLTKRILSLDPAGLLWGSERALLDFLGELPGYEVACCLPLSTPLVAKLQERNIHCFPYFLGNLHQRGFIPKILSLMGLIRAIWEFRPHVLHVNQAGASRIALAACRIFRVPCISHVRLLEDVAYLSALKPNPHYLKHLIAISTPIAEEISCQPGLNKIPCSMLLDAYRSSSGNIVNPNASKDWDFVCVGRLCESKGQALLVQALEILRDREIRPKILFIGEINAFGKHLQAKVFDAGLSETVEFLGHSDQVESFLLRSKWLICPSNYEPLGRVLFEAWDFGIPVIAGATSGGAASSVCASDGGLLFDQWTASSLAVALEKALAMLPVSRASMAQNGRLWMIQATDPDRYAISIGRLCDEIIQNSIS